MNRWQQAVVVLFGLIVALVVWGAIKYDEISRADIPPVEQGAKR